jgi:hypothetical protein
MPASPTPTSAPPPREAAAAYRADTAMILTRQAWKRHDEVRPGDETLGYNPATGVNEWTPITAIHHHDAAPVVRLHNYKVDLLTTPNHRWVARHWVQRVRSGPADILDAFVDTDAITSRHALRLAAPAETGSGADISLQEAELLGWVFGDGTVQRSAPAGRTSQAGGHRVSSRIVVYQTKPRWLEDLDALFAPLPHSHYQYSRASGYRSDERIEHMYYLHAGYSRDLLARSGYDHHNPLPFALSLSPKQRTAFMEAVWKAEGWTHRTPTGTTIRAISQTDGPKRDAILLVAYLEGYFARRCRRRNLLTRPWVGGERLQRDAAGEQPVWCVATELGSWTALQAGQVFLTGDSHR